MARRKALDKPRKRRDGRPEKAADAMNQNHGTTLRRGKPMPPKGRFVSSLEKIPISRLKGIGIRYEDDLCDLAYVLLKLDDAKGKADGSIHRHTAYGLACCYATLADVPEETVLAEVTRFGISPRASVERDESCNRAEYKG